MFAFKPWTENAIRVSLIAVIVFNALIPTAAIAMPLASVLLRPRARQRTQMLGLQQQRAAQRWQPDLLDHPLVIDLTGYTYTYGNSAHKHAVTALGSGESYTYDANGNMITRVEGGLTYTQTFNAENRLISVTANSQTTQFLYDGDGTLVKKIKPDGSKTLYPSTTPRKAAAPLRAGVGGIYSRGNRVYLYTRQYCWCCFDHS